MPSFNQIEVANHELAQIWQWNATVPPTIERCIQDIVIEETVKDPSRPAVQSWDGELSYGELDRLSLQLAVQLSDLGVTVGTLVPLCFEKSMWTVVGVLGILRAGGGFVLTDPQQPEARLRTITTEVDAKIVLTSEKQAELGARIAPGSKIVVVGPKLRDNTVEVGATKLPKVPGTSTLYVIFTSGSTGKPKGVVISHENYTSGALPRADAVGYRAHSRVLDFASYAFDVSIDCMLATLSQGGCICVPSDEQRVNDLPGAIRSMNVNMAHMTPSVARVLPIDILSSLEVLGLGGESVSAGDAAIWGEKTKVIIAYGPSECTVGCTINNSITPGRAYTSIGKGCGGLTWIVDPDDHNVLTPVGAVGELLIEGPLVGVGYISEPEKTKEVFIENPTWLTAGSKNTPGRKGRLYKTGDLVKYDPDGSGEIVFAGRKDRQVKLRGQRVELAEIEHHLRSRLPPDTSVAAEVITPGGKDKEPTLVAFIAEAGHTKSDDIDPTTSFSPALCKSLAEMDEGLATELPAYMIPAAYIPLRQMPQLVSCKLDRKRLQEIGLGMTHQQLAKFRAKVAEKQAPKTDTEKDLQRIWIKLFGADIDIGANDNFFALGADSLKAMKLVAVARLEGISLTVADIFTHPVLSRMALVAGRVGTDAEVEIAEFSLLDAGWEAEKAREEGAKLCGIDASSVEDMYPCTPLQEGLMALSAKISEAYVAQRVVDLKDLETVNRLKAAFEAVAADCPIMRTRIVQVPGRGLTQVVAKGAMPWSSGTDLEAYLVSDRDQSMGLGEPLARFADISDEKTGKVHLVLTMHHALYDGWSMPLVIERVNKAYHGLKAEGRTPFKSFIKYLCGADRAVSEAYWKENMQGASGRQFPTLPSPGYQTQTDSLLEKYVTLEGSSTSSTTIATAIRGAWALVSSQYLGSDDIVFGETLTGRNAPIAGIEEIEGPLITTVPLRVRVNHDTRISDFLQNIHDQAILRIPHEHFGLQNIRRLSPEAREACELRTGLILHPNVEEVPANTEDNPGNGFVPADDEQAAREALKFNSYALMLVCSLGPKGFLTMASFDSKCVDVPQMEKVLAVFARTVQQLYENPTGQIGELQFVSEEDRNDLWRLSNSASHSIAQSSTWIVDPDDAERLLPVGAIGELLIEQDEESDLPSIKNPSWLSEGCKDSPGREAPLYKTGMLARYNSKGSIIFKGRKDGVAKPKVLVEAKPEKTKKPLTITPREQELLKLWVRVLGISEEIGFNDSFFELGGDSIAAMKLVSEARMESLELTVAQVFKHRTLSDMAKVVESTKVSEVIVEAAAPFSALDVPDVDKFLTESILPLLPPNSAKIMDVLPTRPLQEIAVNGTVQLPRYSARYELFYLDAGVDKERLFKSCRELVSRNEILRTVFVYHAEQCYGVVLEDLKIEISEHVAEGDLVAFSEKQCDIDIETEMPLGSAFVKFLFVQGEGEKSCLIFRISHAQYDEICLPPLLHQLSALYEERPVPEAIPFSEFIYHVLKETIPQSVPYWGNLLQGSSLSVLKPSEELTTRKAIAINKTFDISARSKEITIATLPTAAWALCLARRLGVRDVVFGEVVSGRNINLPNCDTVMGPCWQYIPCRIKFEADWTVTDLLHVVQQQHIKSTQHEGMGLQEIVKNCTDWPASVDWFDSVVHQDVEHVENLAFLGANSRMDTIYPHLEPLREWKIQAFPKGDTICLEVITFEPWAKTATSLLNELGEIMEQLVNRPQSALFA
ncbi:hypothetical protein HYALB_00008189 [Hymenoscyphus albidus]|uniref:Carrier domain-containing protein n=1 Tax=Hymenoscyphus albidus TaxID=595503 RepID=A0A9N9M0X5_9HELO|nr:hypothetical protein HYALB_00008189 [Hymenoscyphus albidus]